MTEPYKGWVVDTRYQLDEPLGNGGMGCVWSALDLRLDRTVAIKQILPVRGMKAAEWEKAVQRLHREAKAAAKIEHPNVMSVYDMVYHAGEPWIVMECVHGLPLSSLLPPVRGPLDEVAAASIGLSVLSALIAVHAEGIVHRDVKPSNILIRHPSSKHPGLRSRVCLVDFGTATIEGHHAITTHTPIGTPAFMAPERWGPDSGPKADLWSLGVTLYEAVEGRMPFPGIAGILNHPPEPTRLADALGPVIAGLLMKDPAQRLNSAEAAELLTKIVEGSGKAAEKESDEGNLEGGDANGWVPSIPGGLGETRTVQRLPPGTTPRQAANLLHNLTGDRLAEQAERLMPETDAFVLSVLDLLSMTTAAELLAVLPAERAAGLLPDAKRVSRLVDLMLATLQLCLPLRALTPQQGMRLLPLLGAKLAARTLVHLRSDTLRDILSGLGPRHSAAFLDEIPTAEDTLAMLRALPGDLAGPVMNRMDPKVTARAFLCDPVSASELLAEMDSQPRSRVEAHLRTL